MKYTVKDIARPSNLVRSCCLKDIEFHYSKVKHLVEIDNYNCETYKILMKEAVINNTAFTLLDNTCFIYYINQSDFKASGCCFYGKDNPTGMFVLFSQVFNTLNKKINILEFLPHNKNEIKNFKSILVESSIKNYYQTGNPLVIRVDKLRNKIKRLLIKCLL